MATQAFDDLPEVDDLSAFLPLGRPDPPEVSASDFRQNFGEDLHQVLDVNTWRAGADLHQEYGRIEREVHEAIKEEGSRQQAIREHVFPKLESRREAPAKAGKHEAKPELLAAIHRELLFNGGVEACHGAIQVHDTLPLTIYQIGVSLVSYRGDQGTWCQRLFRRDLRQSYADPVEEVLQLLERRSRRDGADPTSPHDALGELAQRAVLGYAERAILLQRSNAVWRMGRGNPITYELLTGGGVLELMLAATNVLRELIEKHQKFVFVARQPKERMLLTLGHALRPYEFLIVGTLDLWLHDWFAQRRFAVGVSDRLKWDSENLAPAEWIPRFIERVASQVVVGLYRATRLSPAQLFYAHVDHADMAGHIAIADSMLQEHRGFPLLMDLADHVSKAVFGGTLETLTEAAYAKAGAPWSYFSERSNVK